MLQVSPMSAHRREEPHTFLKLPAPHLGFEGQSLSVDSNPELQDPIYSAPRRQRSRLSCLSILLLQDSEMGFVQKKIPADADDARPVVSLNPLTGSTCYPAEG